jgi:head-tail adaptor
VNIGLLNRRIQIQSQTGAGSDPCANRDDAGGLLPAAWTTIYTCWASIDIQGSQLLYSTAEFISKVTYRITIRWTSSVVFAANQRIVYTEATTGVVHIYTIEAVLNDQQGNQQITLLCYTLDGQE